jgi:hypothetical protein
LPPDLLDGWARVIARVFPVGQPDRGVALLGGTLLVRSDRLDGHAVRVHGVWDPVLRRVELYGCDAARSDEELVRTLGHELWHLMAVTRQRVTRRAGVAAQQAEERLAGRFATAWVRHLGADGVRRCAAALRAQAVDGPATAGRAIDKRAAGPHNCDA